MILILIGFCPFQTVCEYTSLIVGLLVCLLACCGEWSQLFCSSTRKMSAADLSLSLSLCSFLGHGFFLCNSPSSLNITRLSFVQFFFPEWERPSFCICNFQQMVPWGFYSSSSRRRRRRTCSEKNLPRFLSMGFFFFSCGLEFVFWAKLWLGRMGFEGGREWEGTASLSHKGCDSFGEMSIRNGLCFGGHLPPKVLIPTN